MVSERGWQKWIAQYKELQDKLDFSDASLPPAEARQLNYLRNLLEAGIGTKTTLSEDNRRTSVRVPCEREISIRFKDIAIKGVMCNMSTTGVFIACNTLPPAGESVVIELEGMAGEKITRTAYVKWVTEKGGSDGVFDLPPGFGAQLDPDTKENEEPFRELFYYLLERRIVNPPQ